MAVKMVNVEKICDLQQDFVVIKVEIEVKVQVECEWVMVVQQECKVVEKQLEDFWVEIKVAEVCLKVLKVEGEN